MIILFFMLYIMIKKYCLTKYIMLKLIITKIRNINVGMIIMKKKILIVTSICLYIISIFIFIAGYKQTRIKTSPYKYLVPFTYSIATDGTTYTWIDGQGAGTSSDPYMITSQEDFLYFISLLKQSTLTAKNLKGIYFELTTDLDFTGYESMELPDHLNSFYGYFDGKGHVIKNLTAHSTSSQAASLFSRINGVVCNLGLVGGTFDVKTGADMSATFASRLETVGVVYNCFSTVNLIYNTTSSAKKPAGFIGYANQGSVYNCYYGGTITATTGSKIYGFARISGTSNVKFTSVYTGTNVNSTINYGTDGNNTSTTKIDITSQSSVDILNNYQKSVSGDYMWELSEDGTYITFEKPAPEEPEIPEEPETPEEPDDKPEFLYGDGSSASPYLITSIEDVIKFRTKLKNGEKFEGIYFKQTKNIDFEGEDAIDGFTYDKVFSGVYDGAGHYIKNLQINGNNGAFFGGIVSGTLKNFGFVGGQITDNAGKYYGTIARRLEKANIINVYSTMDVYVTKQATTSATGLFGAIDNSSTLNNIYQAGTVTYAPDAPEPNIPFMSLFSIASNISKTNIKINNAFWPQEYYGYNHDNGDVYDFNKDLNFLGGDNVMSLSRDQMKSEDLVDYLNEYCTTSKSEYYWTLSADSEYPILTSIKPPELEKVTIKNLKVDGYDNEGTTDKINWYFKNSQYYIFLPKAFNRANLKVEFEIDDENGKLNAYNTSNQLLGEIQNNIPTSLLQNNVLVLKAEAPNKKTTTYTINIKQSNTASLFIAVDGGKESFDAILNDTSHETAFPGNTIIFDESNNAVSSPLKEIKGRGNKTWTLPKRPYQIKYNDKVSMLGMKEAKTWLLLAGYTDGSLSRNAIAQTLAKNLGVEYSVEFEPVDLYINNDYMGSFLLTSKIEQDANRVNINKGLGEDKDFLLEIDNYPDDFQFKSSKGHTLTIKSPKLEGLETTEATAKINEIKAVISKFETALYKTTPTYEELSQIIDMDSFAKFYWVEEYLQNYDFMVGSCYLYYKDGLIHMGPIWDMDNTLNRSYFVANMNEYYSLGNSGLKNRRGNTDWYSNLFKVKEFQELVDKYFIENKESFSSLTTTLDTFAAKQNNSFEMNYIRWPYSEMQKEQTSAWTAGENDYLTAISNLRNNLTSRYTWYSNEYRGLELEKVIYTYTLNNGTQESMEVVPINNTIDIKLPIDVDITKTINISYVTTDGKISDNMTLTNSTDSTKITMSNKTYEDELYLSNTISGSYTKKVNSNSYKLNIRVTPQTIEIVENPSTMTFYEGKTFDPTGMKVVVKYLDDTEREITEYEYKNTPLTLDDTSLTISYCGAETTLENLTIIGKNRIEVTTPPSKLEYIEGDKFNKNGMVVSLVYNDETKEEITNYTYKTSKLTLADTNLLIQYDNYQTVQPITIVQNIATEVKIITPPTKLTYKYGELFDPTGMVVSVIYLNGKESIITDYTYKQTKLKKDDEIFEINYNDLKTTLNLTIESVVQSYTITIPDEIVLEDNKTTNLEISVNDLEEDYDIDVYINSTNNYQVKNNDILLKYSIYDNTNLLDLTVNNKLVTLNKNINSKVFLLKLNQKAIYAGNYVDTLTFTVNVND